MWRLSFFLFAYLFIHFALKQFMEVIKLENMGYYRDDMIIPEDVYLLQVRVLQLLAGIMYSIYSSIRFFSTIYTYKTNNSFGCNCPQLCNGADEHAHGTYAELIFTPIDASFSDDAPILPSGFRIIALNTVSLWNNMNFNCIGFGYVSPTP